MAVRDEDEDTTALQRYRVAAEHGMVPALAVLALTRAARYAGIDHRLITAASAVAATVVGLANAHDARPRLCLRCITEIPADASARADRLGTVLRHHHRMNDHPAPRGVTAAAAVLWAAGRTGVASRVAEAPLDGLVLAAVYARWLHHRLRPWCPDCRGHPDDRPRPVSPAAARGAGSGR